MNYRPTPSQRAVIDASDPVLLVLGGAGTGKTTTAAAAVRSTLQRLDEQLQGVEPSRLLRTPPARALFVSFSRAAVAQILERTAEILGPFQSRVEITTYHALAYQLIRQYGTAIGLPTPTLATDSEARLFAQQSTLRYTDLLPHALHLCGLPAIADHLHARWSLIVCDEFQDTNDMQFQFLNAIRGNAQLLLLGDLNQCIYINLPGSTGVGPQRLTDALSLPGARELELPDVSHRDPSGVLPAAAAAIRRREFGHQAVIKAIATNRLEVRADLPQDHEAAVVASVVRELRDEGRTVGVFSHHVDSTTMLSDQLLIHDIDHEVIGLPDCMIAALDAQHAMVSFACGEIEWTNVRQRLAVFVCSCVRGNAIPPLAHALLSRATFTDLEVGLGMLRMRLAGCDPVAATDLASQAHAMLSLPRGQRHWQRAAQLLNSMLSRSMRVTRSAAVLTNLAKAVEQQRAGLLTHATGNRPAPVQLMGLYQSKGREADAAVVVLRSTDYFGNEPPPYESGSRLLYVVLTRARRKTVILLFGSSPPPLIEPLAELGRQTRLSAEDSSLDSETCADSIVVGP
ncbi:UvrD-helicase domain-containing protein [Nonomuraea sp. C10]|uniref:UvrD-helicase domain-containing protein n=1 Tax=Nonomuraea sp. C10 TaxID=2600577 RepID=UPI0011CD8573|nr:UvrD-helicase domain-containing protein [Nonomuraea sp. C10]TXK35120.1 ATP-dependent helicase [Nonomuraea sp. C10]